MASINEKNLALDKPKFQVILIGYDESAEANAAYLKKGINFPALKIEGRDEALLKFIDKSYSGFQPDLALLKPDGTAVEMEDEDILKKLEELVSS